MKRGCGSGRREMIKRIIASITLAFFIAQPALAAAADVIADPKAGAYKPRIDQTANGLPLVQITTPSGAGVSRNQYLQYSVDKRGVILNNTSQGYSLTQQAGYVDANANLARGSARVILNEVTGPNISQLSGYTEVAGRRAEVVIANPNGITCDGCGFINASRGVLTTGTPMIGDSGSLDGFRVTGGDITIQGAGFNASNIDQADLISRAVHLNANVWANSLNIITGANEVNYSSLSATPVTADGPAPAVSIDVAALGGMYANKIRLVGTERGVGVASSGSIAASGDFSLSAEGRITLSGPTSAGGNIDLKSSDAIENNNTLYGQGDVTISAGKELNNSATLAAGRNLNINADNITTTATIASGVAPDGTVGNTGDMALTARNAIDASNQQVIAGGSLTAEGSSINLSGATVQAGQSINLTSRTGDILNNNGNIQAGGDITAAAGGTFDNTGGTVLGSNVTIGANSIINDGSQATIAATGNMNLYAISNLANKGEATIYAANDLVIAGSPGRVQDGSYTTLTGKVLNSSATIETGNDLTIAANEIENKRTLLEIPHIVYPTTATVEGGDGSSIFIGAHQHSQTYRIVYSTIEEDVIAAISPEARMLAGRNIRLQIGASALNDASLIAAGGSFSMNGTSLSSETASGATISTSGGAAFTNRGYLRQRITTIDKYGHYVWDDPCDMFESDCGHNEFNAFVGRTVTVDTIGTVDAVVSASNAIVSNGVTVNNITITPAGVQGGAVKTSPTFTFSTPQNGMFTLRSDPAHPYLIETNPQFTNLKQFLSSDYMLMRLAYDPQHTMKRLGDGFYEQKIIRDQVLQLTGRTFLAGYSSNEDQYLALMNNGITYAQSFGLTPGIALSKEQMAQLTSDMVWLVEQEVDTKAGKQKVLVPTVYLSQLRQKDLKPSGALIAADDIQLVTPGALTNSGVLRADNRILLASADIANLGTLRSGRETTLIAERDITNKGIITGSDVQFSAGRDIRSEAQVAEKQLRDGSSDLVGQQAQIQATESVSMHAGRDAALAGTVVQAGGDIVADTGRNLIIDSSARKERIAVVFNNASTNKESSANILSVLQSGGTTKLQAQNDITLKGAQITAGGQVTVFGSGTVILGTVKDTANSDVKLKDPTGAYLNTASKDETVIGTNINAGGAVTIGAIKRPEEAVSHQQSAKEGEQGTSGNILIEGGSVVSKSGPVTLAADSGITLKEAREKHESLVESRTTKSGMLSSKTTETKDYIKEDLAKGSLISGDRVDLASGKDLKVQGSSVAGTGAVNLSATDDIDIREARNYVDEEHYRMEKKSGVSITRTGVSAGSIKKSSTLQSDADLGSASTIGSTGGAVTLNAGKDVRITGSDAAAATGIDVSGQNITIEAGKDNVRTRNVEEVKGTWFSTGIGGMARLATGTTTDRDKNPYNPQDERQKKLNALKSAWNDNDFVRRNGNEKMTVELPGMNISAGKIKNTRETVTEDITARGSTMNATGDISLTTPGKAVVEGSTLNSSAGAISISAGQGIDIREAREKHLSKTEQDSKETVVLKGLRKVGKSKDEISTDTPAGSIVSAERVELAAGSGDIEVRGSGIVGTNGVTMQAPGNISVASAQSNILENHEKTEKKYGGMKGQGVSVVLGKQAKEDILKVKTDINSPSTVGSTAGDASIISGGDVNIKGSQVITKGDSTIQGQNVSIEAAQDTQQSIQSHQWSQTGLRVKVESPIIDAVQKISDSYKRAKESDDGRLKALYAIRGGQQAYDTYNQYSNSQNNGGKGSGSAIQVKIGYSNTRQRSETITQSNTTVGSSVNAEGDVTIKATGDPAANKGDLAVVGSNIQGKNVSLEAARDIALQSSADTFDSASRNSSSHFSAGVVIGSSGVGVYAEGARGRGKENEDSVTHKETTVTATDTLTINSGQDTNLKGAIAKGQTIKADVGRNLNIESEQDTSTYKARQQNMSGSAQVTYGGGGNASASYMQSKTDADYKSVQEQSGLFAGTGGYDIKVAKNTDLKGAVIASDASADKNILTTDTLTYSDISNRSKYSASSFGGSISASWSGGSNNGSGGNPGTSNATNGARSISISGAPMLGIPSSDSVSGTTRSAVAPGTINTTSNIASLSRDTKNANGSVKNIFDKKKVATNQEVAQVFSEVAYHAVGDIAKSQTKPYEDAKLRYEIAAEQAKAAKQSGDTEKQQQAEAAMSAAQNDMAANQAAYDIWKDGSPAKIALHTLVGTLAAAMGKGDIAGAALGAGISEAAANLTNQLPKALQPLASAIIGAAVSQATGGNPMSGGSTALAGELYNRQLHQAEREYLKNNKDKFIRWYLNEYMDSSRTIADIAKDAERIWNDAINGSGGRTSDDTASPFFDGTIQATPSKPPIAKFFEKVRNDVISLFGDGVREKQDVFMEYLGYLVTGASGISGGSLNAEMKALQATGESGAIEVGSAGAEANSAKAGLDSAFGQKGTDVEAEVKAGMQTANIGNLSSNGIVPVYAPKKFLDTLNIIDATGRAPIGYKGGVQFLNDGRGGGQVLPKIDIDGKSISYKEWDVNPFQKGINRGSERIVTGTDGSAYYTTDHYKTFNRMR